MWRNPAAQTGANESQLGAPRRWGGADGPPQLSSAPPPYQGPGGGDGPGAPGAGGASAAAPGERKRKSRWGAEQPQTSAMPTAISGNVSQRDLDNYAIQVRLDEISRALRTGQVVPPDHMRSPSPPPTYDQHGRRTNTREVRYRRRLEDERTRLVERAMRNDPTFRPPPEYVMHKRAFGGRQTEKVFIPVKEFPEINFFGLLVGPRGNSLKRMERESGGAKISIRGKGSVKEGKGRPGGFHEEETEDLHCLVTGDTDEKIQKCVQLINEVIATAASTPEAQNDHKRNQLRELAALNGTLRDDENQVCQNCGNIGHRKYDCPEQRNFTAGIICRTCGNAGHMARDCTQRRGGPGAPSGPYGADAIGGPAGSGTGMDAARAQQFDSEYASLMAELGETTSSATPLGGDAGAAAGNGTPGGAPGAAPGFQAPGGASGPVDEHGQKIPPWRIPSNWNPPSLGGPRGGGGGPPGLGGGPPGHGPGYRQYNTFGGGPPQGGMDPYAQYQQPQGYGGYGGGGGYLQQQGYGGYPQGY